MRSEETSTGIYRSVKLIPETAEDELALLKSAASKDVSLAANLERMEKGAWMVIIGEGHLLYEPRVLHPTWPTPPAVQDARLVLFHIWCMQQWRKRGELDWAINEALLAASCFEMMRVRPFEPVVKRGARTGPKAGRKGVTERWERSAEDRIRKTAELHEMCNKHRENKPHSKISWNHTFLRVAIDYNASHPLERPLTPAAVKYHFKRYREA